MRAYFAKLKAMFEALNVTKDRIKDYLDWHKTALTICSAMIGSMSFKYGGSNAPLLFKWSTGLFIISMLLLFWSYICVAESKSTPESTYTLTSSTKKIFGSAWFVFMCAFTVMAVGIIIPPSSDLYVTLFMH